jgi:pimeloyl-ACP methyl ester carboxylesterase
MPTIVLVHGAFADSSSWNGVIDPLQAAGHRVVSAANPLRGVANDAATVTDLVASIDGPVVLVAHSYGGAVITNVDPGAGDIAGLVYICAFAPDTGESAFTLADKYAGSDNPADHSTLAGALEPVARADGTTDLYIAQDRFHAQFCADVPLAEAKRMAATQRPATKEALIEVTGERPLWKEIPSCFVVGEQDRNIPARTQRFMAQRAGAKRVLEIPGASHAVAVSQPRAVADMILEAAALRTVEAVA